MKIKKRDEERRMSLIGIGKIKLANIQTEETDCKILNISSSGMKISSDFNANVDQLVKITIHPIKTTYSSHSDIFRVKWKKFNNDLNDGTFYYGLEKAR